MAPSRWTCKCALGRAARARMRSRVGRDVVRRTARNEAFTVDEQRGNRAYLRFLSTNGQGGLVTNPMDRRQFLRNGALGVAGVTVLPSLLAACGSSSKKSGASSGSTTTAGSGSKTKDLG